MISLSFNIRNPYSDRFETLANPHWKISQHKMLELQFDKTTDIIGIDFRLTTRQNHGGLFLSIALLGFEAIVHFYDTRHWVT
jgi:hypothetical protein